jgi:hypothetical protein
MKTSAVSRISGLPALAVAGLLATGTVIGPAVGTAAAADLNSSFATLLTSLGSPAGLAITPTGGATAIKVGNLAGGYAWSTSKVPVAIAAEDKFGQAAVQSDVVPAIVNSDNAAVEALWDKLGGGSTSAAAANAVLRAGGDTGTSLNATTSTGFTAFGQSQWTFANQSTFASRLPCMQDAQHVLTLMRSTGSNQRWGVQSFTGSAVKGGWGPDGGKYDVRQMAVVTTQYGSFGLSMGTVAPTFEAGQQVLNKIGDWVRTNLSDLPYGHC